MKLAYGVLMQRIVTQLSLVAGGETANLDPTRAGAEHPSRILQAPAVVRVSQCQKCNKPTAGRRFCPSCGTEAEIVHASVYWLRDRWHHAHSEEKQRSLVRLALSLLQSARVRQRQNLDMHTREGRFELGTLMVSGGMTARQAAAVYGFSERHAWRLKADAKAEIDRLEAEAQVPYGSLESRTTIATDIDRTKVDNDLWT